MSSTTSHNTPAWRVRGSYFEVCNCEAPCSCRRHGGKPGFGPQFDTCDFALSWIVEDGHFESTSLQGLRVALAGGYKTRETGKPWRVILYVDDRALPEQQAVLA